MDKVSVLLIGIGGYGGIYLRELLYGARAEQFRIVGTVDPYGEKRELFGELRRRGIPVYAAVEEFYEMGKADLAIVATPIFLHGYQARYCMEHGSDVLCEKPICATLAEAEAMLAARNRTGRRLAIGFQWCYSESILRLKRDILAGMYGALQRMRTIVLFPRGLDYYDRGTRWAGKRRLDSGEWVLDSVASNSTAHYLQNMLFLTGRQIDRSAEICSVQAEAYRANPIEMYDTCALRIRTKEDVELLFYATHAVPMDQELLPEFILEGEKGTVMLKESLITGSLKGGQTIEYGEPCPDSLRTLSCLRDAILENAPIPCVAETAMSHLNCVYALAENFPEPPRFPKGYIRYDEAARQYTCKGLRQTLERCKEEGKLPYELQLPWACPPCEIQIKEKN